MSVAAGPAAFLLAITLASCGKEDGRHFLKADQRAAEARAHEEAEQAKDLAKLGNDMRALNDIQRQAHEIMNESRAMHARHSEEMNAIFRPDDKPTGDVPTPEE